MPESNHESEPRRTGATPVPLEQEFKYYLSHQDDLVAQYDGKVVVIKGQTVLGVFQDELTAVTETSKSHEIGTFLVQRVSKGSAAYTQTYHSRVVFT